jgi:hypothetical protein
MNNSGEYDQNSDKEHQFRNHEEDYFGNERPHDPSQVADHASFNEATTDIGKEGVSNLLKHTLQRIKSIKTGITPQLALDEITELMRDTVGLVETCVKCCLHINHNRKQPRNNSSSPASKQDRLECRDFVKMHLQQLLVEIKSFFGTVCGS